MFGALRDQPLHRFLRAILVELAMSKINRQATYYYHGVLFPCKTYVAVKLKAPWDARE